jgi:hypothetical protein
MDAMTFLGFLLVTLLGGVMFVLITAFLDAGLMNQEPRERSVAAEPVVQPLMAPGFFATLEAQNPPPAVSGFDDALLAFLENHVRAEQTMATRFVRYPSVHTLYRPSQPAPRPTMH